MTFVQLSDDQIAGLQTAFKDIVGGAVDAIGAQASDFLAAYTK